MIRLLDCVNSFSEKGMYCFMMSLNKDSTKKSASYNDSDLQKMIQQYKQQLMDFSKKTGAQIGEDPMNLRQTAQSQTAAVSSVADSVQLQESESIASLETVPEMSPKTNLDRYRDNWHFDSKAWEEFLSQNPGTGYLKTQAVTADGLLPLPNASVTVTKKIGDEKFLLYTLKTDVDGRTQAVPLPAPLEDLSLHPKQEGSPAPYATYTVRITYPNYVPVVDYNVPIFDQITSIQNHNMSPDIGVIGDEEPQVNIETEPEL